MAFWLKRMSFGCKVYSDARQEKRRRIKWQSHSPEHWPLLANIYRIKAHHFNVDAKHPAHNDSWAVKSNSTSPMSLHFLTLSFQFFIFISLSLSLQMELVVHRHLRICRRIRRPRRYGDKWKFRDVWTERGFRNFWWCDRHIIFTTFRVGRLSGGESTRQGLVSNIVCSTHYHYTPLVRSVHRTMYMPQKARLTSGTWSCGFVGEIGSHMKIIFHWDNAIEGNFRGSCQKMPKMRTKMASRFCRDTESDLYDGGCIRCIRCNSQGDSKRPTFLHFALNFLTSSSNFHFIFMYFWIGQMQFEQMQFE